MDERNEAREAARDEIEQAGEDLRAAVWQLTTTDEIVSAINSFKENYSG